MVEYSGENRNGKAERERRSDLKTFALFIYGEVRYVASSLGKMCEKKKIATRYAVWLITRIFCVNCLCYFPYTVIAHVLYKSAEVVLYALPVFYALRF